MSSLLILATSPACGEALETRRGCTFAARGQWAARNPAQIVRCAPDWGRLPYNPLNLSSLRRGFARKGERIWPHGVGRETEMQELMSRGVD